MAKAIKAARGVAAFNANEFDVAFKAESVSAANLFNNVFNSVEAIGTARDTIKEAKETLKDATAARIAARDAIKGTSLQTLAQMMLDALWGCDGALVKTTRKDKDGKDVDVYNIADGTALTLINRGEAAALAVTIGSESGKVKNHFKKARELARDAFKVKSRTITATESAATKAAKERGKDYAATHKLNEGNAAEAISAIYAGLSDKDTSPLAKSLRHHQAAIFAWVDSLAAKNERAAKVGK